MDWTNDEDLVSSGSEDGLVSSIIGSSEDDHLAEILSSEEVDVFLDFELGLARRDVDDGEEVGRVICDSETEVVKDFSEGNDTRLNEIEKRVRYVSRGEERGGKVGRTATSCSPSSNWRREESANRLE